MFDSPDTEEKNKPHLKNLLRQDDCCIGGVDFITLVCAFVCPNILACTTKSMN